MAGIEKYDFDPKKLTRYSLDPERQPDKARAFKKYLGYEKLGYLEVMSCVYEYMADHGPASRNTDAHGNHYTIDMNMVGKDSKRAKDRIGWIRDVGATKLRLVTIYVDE